MVLTLPEAAAETANAALGNQLLPFPLDVSGPDIHLFWPHGASDDPANRWLREQLLACFGRAGSADDQKL
jgi:DNA-binding transcriptional LysR family regulator